MDQLYTLSSYGFKGYSGDEDNGEMAAWYVLSALGLYQLENAADELVVGAPNIVEATLSLPHGHTLRVTTEGQVKNSDVQVSSVKWTPEGGDTRDVVGNVIKFS